MPSVSTAAKVEIYRYDWFDIPPTPGTNASPLAIAVDAQERVWVNQEFHLDFQGLDIPSGVVSAYSPPHPASPGPFASAIFSDHRTQTSVLGEAVIVDPQGRIWFSEGGQFIFRSPSQSQPHRVLAAGCTRWPGISGVQHSE